MDDNYRKKLDQGMSIELARLEGEAREEGDYCDKHNLYIGDKKLCPWCEIDALNEKCCPGDLRPTVVARWPMAARRALMHFQTELAEKDKRIEELERDLHLAEEELYYPDKSQCHVITYERVNSLVRTMKHFTLLPQTGFTDSMMWQLLAEIKVYYCRRCGGRGTVPNGSGISPCSRPCPDCAEWGSNGWAVSDE